ncbi:MAG TPA: hypothetical protein VFV38_45900 [Ktedonobacteraceae bacterium]|nr:hypothetical protein [Ktedonobacteraceae bacterium]
MPVAPLGGSPSGPPASTTRNPWARSLADLLEPWTDTLDDLYAAAASNYKYCDGPPDGSLYTFEKHCDRLVGASDVWFQESGAQGVPFQGLGAQAFNNVYLLNVDQAGVINGKIQDFQNASHDLLTSIQSLNAQYELRPDGGIYWNAGSGYDPWKQVISQFLDNPMHDNNYVLSTLMDGFLTNTAIDDLLKPGEDSTFLTVSSGVQIGVDQITREINSSYQTQAHRKDTGTSPSDLGTQHQEALDMLHGFANNMISQVMQWANELYALAQTYLGKVIDAGNIPELTQPLPPKNGGSPHPDPLQGPGAGVIDANPKHLPPTRATYLSQSETASGLLPGAAIDTVYASGTDLGQMSMILHELQGKVQGSSAGVLANFLGDTATAMGIVSAFLPLLGEVGAGASLTLGIAGALIGGANAAFGQAVSQRKTSSSDAIGELIQAFSQIQANVSSMPPETKARIVLQLSEEDTYQDVFSPTENPVDLGTDYTQIASAKFTLSCYTT